jgi:RNA polymerase sigma-32 factor
VIGNLTPEGNLSRYLEQIKRFPMLSAEEEYTLAKDWKDKDNLEAAHKLVTSHLRLVAKIAMGYRGYGLPMGELIAEGNLGMMHAVKRFEPEKGFRLSTYAMWWIRASIQEYILRSWSLVKIGTTAAQKKLFFNLRRIKGEIKAIDDGDMAPEQVTEIAERLDVPEMEVINMNRRLGPGDHSLNATIGGESEGGEWLDWLEDDSANQEVTFAEAEEYDSRRQLLVAAMDELNAREVEIIKARRLSDTPLTLEELSQRFGVSRERIRQIEARAFEKLQLSVRNRAIENKLIES